MFTTLGSSQRYHCTAVMENIREWDNTCLPKSVCSQKRPGRKVKFLRIPTSVSSTWNTQYLELCNFFSKWIHLKTLSILMQFLYFDQSIFFHGSIYTLSHRFVFRVCRGQQLNCSTFSLHKVEKTPFICQKTW